MLSTNISLLGLLLFMISPVFCSPFLDSLFFLTPRQITTQAPSSPCRLNYTTNVWTSCEDVLAQFKLSLADFRAANPKIGEECDGFTPGEKYCVALYQERNITASQDGNCGIKFNFNTTCVGSKFGDCCGADGKCGSGENFCGIGNCQEGSCRGGGPWSTDGRCGKPASYVPCPPKFGLCCSKDGLCSNGTLACGSGCQYGDCSAKPTTTTSSPTNTKTTTVVNPPTQAPGSISKDGTCAYKRKLKCKGSKFGDCCSAAGYCGKSQYHCSKLLGCQADFGTCS